MASRCIHCLQSRVYKVAKLSTVISSASSTRELCIKAKVPHDVLNSKAHLFSGKTSVTFTSEKVQNLLKKLTGINLDKVFAARKEELSNPVYKVLDEKELKEAEEKIKQKAAELLRMPAVKSQRKPIHVVLSEDKDIIGHDEDGSNFVFTDISTSKNNMNRAVIVRENATGVLREGSWDERDRMQFIYWPKEGQLYEIPPMLQDDVLPRIFDQLRHNEVLDLINLQCEPDAPDYIRVHQRVYDDLESRQQYDLLHSTRHFGGMVFYYVINGRTNKLLEYYVRSQRLSNAIDLVKLHLLIHSKETSYEDLDEMDLLQHHLTQEGLLDLLKYFEENQKSASQESSTL